MKPRNLCPQLTFLATLWFAASLHAQTGPTGFWDFSIHGKRQGTAVLEFTMDSAFGGSIVGRQVTTSPPGVSTAGSSEETVVNVFGGAELAGQWAFTAINRIVGNYVELSEVLEADMLVPKTNSVSFTATYSPGKRLTLRTESAQGKAVLRGQPNVPQDISGEYLGEGRRAGILYVDAFDLAADPVLPNVFTVTGGAADHTFSGLAILASNKRIALLATRDDLTGLSSVAGSYDSRRNSAKSVGYNSKGQRLVYKVFPPTTSSLPGPTGFWDFSVHGQHQGVAVLEFTMDSAVGGSIFGVEVNALPRRSTSAPKVNPRTGSADPDTNPRTGQSDPSNGSSGTNVLSFGGANIGGAWFFSSSRRLIGTFIEVSEVLEGDTLVPKTNSVSFSASYSPGKRLVFRAESDEGKFMFRGQPTLPRDISGNYLGQGRQDGILYVDSFDLVANPVADNVFDLTGAAADGAFDGMALISSNYRIAIFASRDDMTEFRSLSGTYNQRRGTARLIGQTSDNDSLRYDISKR